MKKNAYLIIITILLCSIVFFLINRTNQNGKLAWININKTYNEFVFKKELETKLATTQQVRKKIIDSLEFELKVLSREIKAEEGKDKNKISVFETKREHYIGKKNELDEDNAVLEKQYNDQIINQLNQYLKDYGKEQGFRYIFGTDGSGSLMYAVEGDEITEDAIKYINEKYKGKTN
ncbi:MAG TPA: OmpH family outer membrane protein [Bacteroidia bacterium]|nr:OmpH family outer membrane protein [Bacteroidia bacterium]